MTDLRSKAETSQWVVDEVRSRLLAAAAGKLSEGNTGNTEEGKSLWLQISIHCSGAKEFSQPTFSVGFPNNCLCSNIHQHDLFISSFFLRKWFRISWKLQHFQKCALNVCRGSSWSFLNADSRQGLFKSGWNVSIYWKGPGKCKYQGDWKVFSDVEFPLICDTQERRGAS